MPIKNIIKYKNHQYIANFNNKPKINHLLPAWILLKINKNLKIVKVVKIKLKILISIRILIIKNKKYCKIVSYFGKLGNNLLITPTQ